MPTCMEQRATGRRRFIRLFNETSWCLRGRIVASQDLNKGGMCTHRSQNTYPTSAAEYELEMEIGKGACGTVSSASTQHRWGRF